MDNNQIVDILMDITEKINVLTAKTDMLVLGQERLEGDVSQLKTDG